MQYEKGATIHLRLNMDGRPIENKYCEGKMKRTLKMRVKKKLKLEIGKVKRPERRSEGSERDWIGCTLCVIDSRLGYYKAIGWKFSI